LKRNPPNSSYFEINISEFVLFRSCLLGCHSKNIKAFTFWPVANLAWIERNGKAFNNGSWPAHKRHKLIWDALVDYGRTAWAKCMNLLCKYVLIEKINT
jgi:hypothetical protein